MQSLAFFHKEVCFTLQLQARGDIKIIEADTAFKIKILITNGIALFTKLLCHFQGILINNAVVALNTHLKFQTIIE